LLFVRKDLGKLLQNVKKCGSHFQIFGRISRTGCMTTIHVSNLLNVILRYVAEVYIEEYYKGNWFKRCNNNNNNNNKPTQQY